MASPINEVGNRYTPAQQAANTRLARNELGQFVAVA